MRFLGLRLRAFELVCGVLSILLLFELEMQLVGRAYTADPHFVRFYYNESRERLDAGDPAEAARGFSGVIRLDSTFAPAHAGLGMIALLEGRYDDAIESLQEAVRLSPEHADAHNSLGSALLAAGRPEEALAAFRRAVDFDPTFAMAWYNLGGTMATLGRKDEAREVLPVLQRLNLRLASQLAQMLQ